MKISKTTINLLKNFSNINSNLVFKPGKKLSTWATQKNIIASVTAEEEFPSEFGIYDLSEFLGAMSLFTDPDLEFSEKYVTIKEGANSIKYFAADTSVLVAPNKEVKFPEAEINFSLTADTLSMVQKTASVLRTSDLAIVGDGSKLKIVVGDKKNETGNSFEVAIGDTDVTCKVYLKVENLKLIPGAYEVSISSKKISRFKSSTTDLMYYLAIEQDSSFVA